MDYLVQDFVALCQQLTPKSRTIFVDLGASLQFHGSAQSPALYITTLFSKFGFPFDHIYAFEITPTSPNVAYDKVPDKIRAAYHWNNVGISADVQSNKHPWNFIRQNFNEDDVVVVKLDIDTPSVELPLVEQLLNDTSLHSLIDHFYFEHHVHLKELEDSWGTDVKGSVADSLRLFHGLRKAGVAAHSWV